MSPRAAGQPGTQPCQLNSNVWTGRLSLPTGFLKAWVTYLALIQKTNGIKKLCRRDKAVDKGKIKQTHVGMN